MDRGDGKKKIPGAVGALIGIWTGLITGCHRVMWEGGIQKGILKLRDLAQYLARKKGKKKCSGRDSNSDHLLPPDGRQIFYP